MYLSTFYYQQINLWFWTTCSKIKKVPLKLPCIYTIKIQKIQWLYRMLNMKTIQHMVDDSCNSNIPQVTHPFSETTYNLITTIPYNKSASILLCGFKTKGTTQNKKICLVFRRRFLTDQDSLLRNCCRSYCVCMSSDPGIPVTAPAVPVAGQ